MFINSKNIQFSYQQGKNVLNDISFNLFQGETLAIVGASGCGKSTLLRILAGILPKEKGSNFLGSVTIDGLSPDQYRQTGNLAFMFQEATLLPHLNVRQNIELPLKIKGIENKQKINSLIETVGLEDYSHFLPKQLSGGMKTRVALARSFSTNPELLLLDEPFSALDIAWKSKLYVELERLKEQYNSTVIIVTHDVQEALLLSNKVIILGKTGNILEEEEQIQPNYLILDRVSNISDFIETESFRHLFSSIQKWIVNDAVRGITPEGEGERIINQIKMAAGNKVNERQLNDSLASIYPFANNEYHNAILFESFEKGTSYFKNELIWDILSYERIDDNKIQVVLNYYLNNIEAVSTQARDSFYKIHPDRLFNKLVRMINDNSCHPQKRWVYLLDMFASSETEKVLRYLKDAENGKIEQLNYQLAKTVAGLVKSKIKDEKQNIIFID